MSEKFSSASEEAQKSLEALRSLLSHYPTGSGWEKPDARKIRGYVEELGEPIAVRTGAQAYEDGWYVQNGEGGIQKFSGFDEDPIDRPPQNAYLVYEKGGTISVNKGRPSWAFELQFENNSSEDSSEGKS